MKKNGRRNGKLWRRIIIMLAGVVGMGFFLSFLIEVDYGTDSCSAFNLALSNVTGIQFGTCSLLTHLVLLIPILIWKWRLIGLGTLANMTMIGYISDFCRMIWQRALPEWFFQAQPLRLVIFIVSLLGMVLCAALYMNVDLGVAPFDGAPMLVADKVPLPFFAVRMLWDAGFILLSVLMGGPILPATVGMALLMGPVVAFVGKILGRFLELEPSGKKQKTS